MRNQRIIFLFFIISMFFLLQTDNQSQQHQKNEVFIVFIQSDLDSQSNTDKSNFVLIWKQIMPELLQRIAKRKDALVLLYPLNENTSEVEQISSVDLRKLFGQTPYKQEKILNKCIGSLKKEHAKLMKKDNNFQDIVSSYLVLTKLRDNLLDIKKIKVIFISDMVHYLTSGESTDSEKGLFNFAYEYSLDVFNQNIKNNILYEKIEIGSILNKNINQDLKIFSFFLPRGEEREKLSDSIRDKLDNVWKAFFKKIGSGKTRLNLLPESIDQIFLD